MNIRTAEKIKRIIYFGSVLLLNKDSCPLQFTIRKFERIYSKSRSKPAAIALFVQLIQSSKGYTFIKLLVYLYGQSGIISRPKDKGKAKV